METDKKNDFQKEVDKTRELVMHREWRALLVWGCTTFLIGLLIYGLQYLTGDYYGILWVALPVIAMPLHAYQDKKNDIHRTDLTPLYKMLGALSRATCVLVLITALLSIPVEFHAYFVILLILSIWCLVSGYMLDYKPFIGNAIGGFIIAIVSRAILPNCELVLFIFGVAIVLIAPGLTMRRQVAKMSE